MNKTVESYIDGVESGEITACRFVKLAVKRHLEDLKNGKDRGLYFDEKKAQHAIDFFKYLKLWKGAQNKGKQFVLSNYFTFITWVLMGWQREETGKRRFTKAFIEVARKNSKTTYAGGLGAYFFIADGESGAELYTAAVTRDQARLVWDNIKNLTKRSIFAKKITYLSHNMSILDTWSKCQPLSSDAKSMDGLDIHFASLDELHAHPKPDIYHLINDATQARKQPMILSITTAGFDQQGICYTVRDYIAKILKGTIQDDSYFGIIYTLDVQRDWPDLKEDDDWQNEDNWEKSLPGIYGVTKSGKVIGLDIHEQPEPGRVISIEKIRDHAKLAKEQPSMLNNFLTKHMNIWTQQENRWIDMLLWEKNFKCKIDENKFNGQLCFGGLDLSAVSDFSALCLIFPDADNILHLLLRFWCPEAKIHDKANRYKDNYISWKKSGHLIPTDGNAIDYAFLKHEILKLSQKYKIEAINVDRNFQGYGLSMELEQEGIQMLPCGTGFASMEAPMKSFEALLLKQRINHGNHPVMRFCADNFAVNMNPSGGLKPDKATSQGKIDGIVAFLLALDRYDRYISNISVYEKRGILTL